MSAVLNACGMQVSAVGVVVRWQGGLPLAARTTRLTQAVIAGTYFGRLFTRAYVQQRLAYTTAPILRARWQGLEAWPGVTPEDVHCPTLIYTGTQDGNAVVQLAKQRVAIEAAGLSLHVFEGLTHLQLLSASERIAPIVGTFLRAEPRPHFSAQANTGSQRA